MGEPFSPVFPGLGGCEEQVEEDRVLFLSITGSPQITELLKRDYTAGLWGRRVLLSRFLQSACSVTSTMYFACSPIVIIEGDFCPSHGSS